MPSSSSRRPRILLVINSLEGGGAERIMARVAAGLVEHLPGADIGLLLLDDRERAYLVPEQITVFTANCDGSLIRSVRAVYRHLSLWRPTVALSFLSRANVAAAITCRLHRIHCVISERVHTTRHLGSASTGRFARMLIRLTYPLADSIIAVSDGVADELTSGFGIDREKISVIHNPTDLEGIRSAGSLAPEVQLPEKFFVSVGRLTPNKNVACLIRAFARLRRSDVALLILGDGPLRVELENLAASQGVADLTHFLGFVDNPFAIVARACAYVSTSNAEGFPNALVEAMAQGVPAIATDCFSGPSEILARTKTGIARAMIPAKYGILIPPDSVPDLTAALEFILTPEAASRYRERASIRSAHFSMERGLAAYSLLLSKYIPRD